MIAKFLHCLLCQLMAHIILIRSNSTVLFAHLSDTWQHLALRLDLFKFAQIDVTLRLGLRFV